MGKLSKEELARYGGANWILEKCKKDGIEAAEKELEWRGVRQIPLMIKEVDIHNFETYEKRNTIATVLLMACATLRDEYGFGTDRMNRFIERFNCKTECLVREYVNWRDLQKTLEKELGISIPLPEAFMEE